MNPDPPHTVGVNAVVHLIAEDIYLDLRVTSWTSRGGGFSYIRSTPPVPPPILSATNSAGAVTISWTKPADGFVLQQASSLRSPPASNVWATVPFPYQTNATRIFITVPQSPGVKFYRLRK